MTLDEFAEVVAVRIPTASEMVSFAMAQRWRFDVTSERAALMVPNRNDVVVQAFARMLAREPYRTSVLEHLNAATIPAPVAAPPEPPAPKSEAPHPTCSRCGRKTDPIRRCWHCHDRPCAECRQWTGSAFIATCNACAVRVAA